MGVRLGGPGVSSGAAAGADNLAPKIFDIITENRPFRDLMIRVHDIGNSSQVECLCKTE